ncbi:hypothetical protein DL93DRAFT_2075758 [Clavulina sp. PMI_390]|nr:hypothetical protein DL93DRAFT_2075758 [Clavulina sp. PMI_390]
MSLFNRLGWFSSSEQPSSLPASSHNSQLPGGWAESDPGVDGEEPEATTPKAPVTILPDDIPDDTPPAFPAINSIQRSSAAASSSLPSTARRSTSNGSQVPVLVSEPPEGQESASSPSIIVLNDPDTKLMPPPSLLPPRFTAPSRSPASSGGLSPSGLSAPNSSRSSGLLVPLATTTVPANTNKKAKARSKVALAPGHSALDWARLKSSGEDLRCGFTELQRITLSEVKEHRSRDDAWAVFYGKVYNITPYIPFHPGGEKELMRVAGRDGTQLFALTHSWVNLDFMLDGCMIGFLVPEPR